MLVSPCRERGRGVGGGIIGFWFEKEGSEGRWGGGTVFALLGIECCGCAVLGNALSRDMNGRDIRNVLVITVKSL